jgi:hypothetical protein
MGRNPEGGDQGMVDLGRGDFLAGRESSVDPAGEVQDGGREETRPHEHDAAGKREEGRLGGRDVGVVLVKEGERKLRKRENAQAHVERVELAEDHVARDRAAREVVEGPSTQRRRRLDTSRTGVRGATCRRRGEHVIPALLKFARTRGVD